MIPTLKGTLGSGGLIFSLPLTDAGSGAVNTSPVQTGGSGTPTFTRATVAWTKLSTGLWVQVASGTARSCYLGADTTVGAYGGYFSEAAGTQLVTPTASIRDMTDASWVNGGTMTVAKTGTGIDGVTNSCSRLTGGAVSATNTLFQTLTAAATSRTYSCWIKRVTGTGTINISQNGGSTYTDVTSSINSSTFTRVSLTASVLNAAFGIQVVTDTDVILVDFNQFEAGATATSPMASAGAARNADALTFVGSGNAVAATGSAYCEVTLAAGTVSAGRSIATINGGGTAPILYELLQPRVYDGTTYATSGLGNLTVQVTGKVASSWSGSTMKAFLNGTAGNSQSFDGSMGVTTMQIGDSGFLGMNKNVRIYDTAFSDAAMQNMTT